MSTREGSKIFRLPTYLSTLQLFIAKMDKMQICFQTTKKSISKYREKNAKEITGYKEIQIQDKLVYLKKYVTGNQFFQ